MTPESIRSIPVDQISNIHFYGRNGCDGNAVVFFWTASGFSVYTRAGELWAELEGDYSSAEPWVSVWINRRLVSRFIVQKGRHWYCLCRGLSTQSVHSFTLLKETQAMSGDPSHMLALHSLGIPDSITDSPDTVFLRQKEPSLRIEFIGDSITSGEGLAGGVSEMDWIPGWMSLNRNYALQTSFALNADFSFISQCGWGVVSGWDNDRNCALPLYYSQVCGLACGERNKRMGAAKSNDFTLWQPDFIVVNLGTNDAGAFNNPPKKDPVTDEMWKLRKEDDGSLNSDDLNFFRDGIRNFLTKLRNCNPKAKIIWAYGMCSYDLGDVIRETVESFAQRTDDKNIRFLKLPEMSAETAAEKGSRQHPGPGTHTRAARYLVEAIKHLQ